jgi:hypothetical protein
MEVLSCRAWCDGDHSAGGQGFLCPWQRSVCRAIDDRACGLRVISHGGGVPGVAQACSGLRLLAWHSVGDDGTVRGDFFRFLSQFVVV